MKNPLLIVAILSLIGNIALAGMVISVTRNPIKDSSQQAEAQQQFPYLSKRIFTENQNDIIINFIPLRQALREYVEKPENKVGVYFEYLPSGVSIGVNDREEAKLASLSKVPLAMSIYKKIEGGKMSLDDVVVIKKEYLDQKFGDLWKRGEGTKLTVQELLVLALEQSDNTAYYALLDQLTDQEINEVYENLDIAISQEEEKEEGKFFPIVSPKSYSSIFRSLYLSSFLSEQDSNYILKILTQTPFNDKIVAGVASNIQVAHKIGVFTRADTSKDVYIDCGIIYVPNRPYILCIFVKDTNEEAKKHMSYISKMVYKYMRIVKGGS